MQQQSAAGRTYRIQTLGYKANQYDARRLAEAIEALGYREAPGDAPPDLLVVNTCTVTHTADRKSRQLARRAVREHPGARVFVTGCYPTTFPEALAGIEGLAGVYGRSDWPAMMRVIAGARDVPQGAQMAGDFGISSFSGRTRAFLKIQEGCDSFCTYCVVPHVRGRPRSRPLGEVEREALALAEAGFGEIVLTGIHLGLYGRDLAERADLADAVRTVAGVRGVARVRLSSVEPMELTDRLLKAMAASPVVCPHVHLPLQSGDDCVLRRMGRPYTVRQFLGIVARARERLDNPAIATDVMVGFPGETGEEFERTLRLCAEAAFSRVHVFPFSPRPGTPAAAMGDRVPPPVVRERVQRLERLADLQARAWAESFVGRTVNALLEERRPDGRLTGYTRRYVRISAPGPADLLGRAVDLLCTGADGPALMGEVPERSLDTCSR